MKVFTTPVIGEMVCFVRQTLVGRASNVLFIGVVIESCHANLLFKL